MKELILEMEDYAQKKNVLITEKKTIAFIMKYIKENNIKNILEIGGSIGYCSILMASASSDAFVTTIERDEERYMECLKNVKKCNLDKKINVVFQDALDVNLSEDLKYDLIFIDAAKGQYERLFEKYKYFLKKNGVIITDNLKLKVDNKNIKSVIEKMEDYIDFLKENEEFDTKFYDIGDGLAVSKWKVEK